MLTIRHNSTVTLTSRQNFGQGPLDLVVWHVTATPDARAYVTDQWLSSPGDVEAAVMPHPDGEQALVFGRGVWNPEDTERQPDGTVTEFTFAPKADNPPFLVPTWNLDDTDEEPSCSHATGSYDGDDPAEFVAWLTAHGIPAEVRA